MSITPRFSPLRLRLLDNGPVPCALAIGYSSYGLSVRPGARTDGVAALFVTYASNPDGTTTKTGVLYDWPVLK